MASFSSSSLGQESVGNLQRTSSVAWATRGADNAGWEALKYHHDDDDVDVDDDGDDDGDDVYDEEGGDDGSGDDRNNKGR